MLYIFFLLTQLETEGNYILIPCFCYAGHYVSYSEGKHSQCTIIQEMNNYKEYQIAGTHKYIFMHVLCTCILITKPLQINRVHAKLL